MKKVITTIALFLAINAQAQKILSHTTLIGKFFDNRIELTEYTDGTSCYAVYLVSSKLKLSGLEVSTTDMQKIQMRFDTKEQLIKCLRYLYDFDKGEGYSIALENKTDNIVFSTNDGFIVTSHDQIDTPHTTKITIGKLLKAIGEPTTKND